MKKEKIKNGFTLAETLITLSILGIVAAITIPSLVGKQIENQNRTKLKKAMTTYEKAINNMLIENDLQTEESFKAWAKKDATTNNYQEQVGYFKVAEMSTLAGSENCRFKTGERIWWDICGTNDSNIENPIIILDEKYKDTPRTDENGLEALAKVEKVDGKKVYVYALVGHRDATTGSVRINDKAYETTSPNKEYLEKDYAFLEKREMAVADAGGGVEETCETTTTCSTSAGGFSCYVYDCHDNQIVFAYNCESENLSTCSTNVVSKYDSDGNKVSGGYDCSDPEDETTCKDRYTIYTKHNTWGDYDIELFDCTDYNDYTSCNVCSKKRMNANEYTICREMGYTADCPNWNGFCKP